MPVPVNENTNVGGKAATEEEASHTSPGSPTVPLSLSSSSSFLGPPSPLLEPVGSLADKSTSFGNWAGGNQDGFIKIGQTGLHNPGGRSSWIGL